MTILIISIFNVQHLVLLLLLVNYWPIPDDVLLQGVSCTIDSNKINVISEDLLEEGVACVMFLFSGPCHTYIYFQSYRE